MPKNSGSKRCGATLSARASPSNGTVIVIYDAIYEPTLRHFHTRWQSLAARAVPEIRERAARAIAALRGDHCRTPASPRATRPPGIGASAPEAAREQALRLAELESARLSEVAAREAAEQAARREAEEKRAQNEVERRNRLPCARSAPSPARHAARCARVARDGPRGCAGLRGKTRVDAAPAAASRTPGAKARCGP